MSWDAFQDWFLQLEWRRLLPELIGKGLGFLAGFAASWFLLFRRRLRDLQRFQQGDSDDILFQAHYLLKLNQPTAANSLNEPTSKNGQLVQLVFRNVVSKLTVNHLYDNPAARELIRKLTDKTSLNNPVLPTQGTLGFELLNDAAGFVAGSLASAPFPRKLWMFCMTCEDRTVVRRRCLRCFLIQPDDLQKFADWNWVKTWVRVERPWHWFRLVALHRIARGWAAENARFNRIEDDLAMPLVDSHSEHRHIVSLSLGLPEGEVAVAAPFAIDWAQHQSTMSSWGILLESDNDRA